MRWWMWIAALAPSVLGEPEAHTRLVWKDGCVVELANTPCRTFRWRQYHSSGLLGFVAVRTTDVVRAVDADGSESMTIAANSSRSWIMSDPAENWSSIVLRAQNRTVMVDHDRRQFAARDGGAHLKYEAWEQDDSACSHAVSHYLYLSTRLPDSKIAGYGVVGYAGEFQDRREEYEVYFAPSLGCREMRFSRTRRGFLGVPTDRYERQVESFEIGRPSPDFFAVPSGYKQVSKLE